MSDPRLVVFLLFPQFELIDFSGPASVFGAVRTPSGELKYDIRTTTPSGAGVCSAEGVGVKVDGPPSALPEPINTLVVPGGFACDRVAKDAAFVFELRKLAARSRRITSVCSGSILLAAAGLLDGRKATTHWAATEALESGYPSVQVVRDVVWVRDGDVYTSAGATTGLDLALALVEEDFGPAVAGAVARWMVVFARRPGAQSQSSVRSGLPAPTTSTLRWALNAAVENPAADLSVAALADVSGLSPRHFARLFTEELGVTPGRYVELIRVEAAQQHLAASGATMDVIANASGFRSVETMRRAFHRVLGVSPNQYRRSITDRESLRPDQRATA